MRSTEAVEKRSEVSNGPAGRPLLENDRVRIIRSIIGPGERKSVV